MRLLLVPFLFLIGCDASSHGESSSAANADPRCVAACDNELCKAEDHQLCLDQCRARISGVSSLCATCLVEDAQLSLSQDIYGPCHDDAACGPGGYRCSINTCTYCHGDATAKAACMPPAGTLSCYARFSPTSDCTKECTTSP